MKNKHLKIFLQDENGSFFKQPRVVFQNGAEKPQENENKAPEQKKEVSQLGYDFALSDARKAIAPYLETKIENANINVAALKAKADLDALDVRVDVLDKAAKEANLQKMRSIMERFSAFPIVKEKQQKAVKLREDLIKDSEAKAKKAIDDVVTQFANVKGFEMSGALKTDLDDYEQSVEGGMDIQIEATAGELNTNLANLDGAGLTAEGAALDGVIKKLDGTDVTLNKYIENALRDAKPVAEGKILMEMSKGKDPEAAKQFISKQIDARIAALPHKDEIDNDRSRGQEAKLTQLRDQILASLDAAKGPKDGPKRFTILAYFQDQLNAMDVKPGTPDNEKPSRVRDAYGKQVDLELQQQTDILARRRQESGTLAQRLFNAQERAKKDPDYKVDPKLKADAGKAYLAFREQEKAVKKLQGAQKEVGVLPQEPPLTKAPEIGPIATAKSVKDTIDTLKFNTIDGTGKAKATIDGVDVTITKLGPPSFSTSVDVEDNPDLGITTNISGDPFSVSESLAWAIRQKKITDRGKAKPDASVAENK